MITSLAWWKAAGLRVARSVLVVLTTFLAAFGDGATVAELQLFALTAGLVAVLSLATSWASLPELTDKVRPWWHAVLDRFVRTVGQVLVASLGAAALLTDVDWLVVLQQALWAGLGTVVLGIVSKLPESEPAPQPAAVGIDDARRAERSARRDI